MIEWLLIFCALIYVVACLLLIIFGIRNLIVYHRLKDKRLTDKTTAFLDSYKYEKNALAGRRVIPRLTDYKYFYNVGGKRYKLEFHSESKPSSKNLQQSIQVVYLKNNPKYACSAATRFIYSIIGWLFLGLGLVLSIIFIITLF